jgi:hypothetical protein
VLTRKIFGETDYSGLDSPADALPTAVHAFCKVHEVPPPPIRFVRSCDIGHIQQYVLAQRSRLNSGGAHCVFTDLLDALDEKASIMVDAMAPREGASPAEAAAAYVQMESYLLSESKWAFPSDQVAFCTVHKQMCPMHVGWVLGMRSGGCSASDLLASRTDEVGAEVAMAHAAVPQPWWTTPDLPDASPRGSDTALECMPELLPESEAGLEEPPPPMVIHVAGLTCVDYSSLGAQKQEAGTSNREHAVWIGTRRARGQKGEEDAYFTECAVNYPALVRQAPLNSTHHIVSVLSGPQLQSYPIYRLRNYACGLNRAKWVWVGPSTNPAVQKDFETKFHRPVAARGNIFLSAGAPEVRRFGSELALATSRKSQISKFCDADDESTTSMSEYLHLICSARMMSRKASYEKHFTDSLVAPPWFADLDANLGWGQGAEASFVPTLVTHPRIFVWPKGMSLEGQRFMLPEELLSCHGFGMTCDLHHIFKSLDNRSKGVLLGNGMHLPSLGSFMMYVLSNIKPIGDFYRLGANISGLTSESWEDPEPETDMQ